MNLVRIYGRRDERKHAERSARRRLKHAIKKDYSLTASDTLTGNINRQQTNKPLKDAESQNGVQKSIPRKKGCRHKYEIEWAERDSYESIAGILKEACIIEYRKCRKCGHLNDHFIYL